MRRMTTAAAAVVAAVALGGCGGDGDERETPPPGLQDVATETTDTDFVGTNGDDEAGDDETETED